MAPLTGFQIAQQQGANANTLNTLHVQAGQAAHFTNLAFASLIQDDLQPVVFA